MFRNDDIAPQGARHPRRRSRGLAPSLRLWQNRRVEVRLALIMNVLLFITSHRMGGAEHYFLRLAAFLRERGHRLVVVSKPQAEVTRRLRERGFLVHTWPMWGKGDLLSLLRLVGLIRREEVEVVNTHLSTAHWWGGWAGRWTNVPTVARVAATNRATWLRHASWWWAVSEGVKEHLIAQGLPPERIVVLYNGLDGERFQSLPPREEARRLWGLPSEAVAIGTVANLVPRKGHRFLLEAVAQVQRDFPRPLHLLWAGEGPTRRALEQQAGEKGMASQVHFLGYLSDVRPLLAALDLFVLPSLQEGLPSAVLEAMAAGVPVIATEIPGLPEAVVSGQTGLLVPPAQVEALAEALRRVLRNPEEAQHWALNARRWVKKRFEQRRCLLEVEAFLQRVARGGS